MSIVLVGISHHKAPVELRERAALDSKHAGELARTLAGDNGEAVCLSTCNRTELYLADESADAAEEKAEAALLALESELGPRSTGSAVTRPHSTSSASPPGSTR